jgi:hypothetical protein
MFRGSPPNNVIAEIHASSKRLPPQRRHYCSSNPLEASYRTPAALFCAFAGVVVSRIRMSVCPPLCPAFTYYRLLRHFHSSRSSLKNLEYYLECIFPKGSDVSDLPFKPRLRPLECGGKQSTPVTLASSASRLSNKC